jgi:hypothetical protein
MAVGTGGRISTAGRTRPSDPLASTQFVAIFVHSRGEYLSPIVSTLPPELDFQTIPRGIPVAPMSRMNSVANSWRRLSLDLIAELPEQAAVFEVANLVRTIHYIGSATNLRERVNAYWQELRATPGGYYLRYESAQRAEEAAATRLATYRSDHGGLLPAGNSQQAPRPLRVASRRAA